MKLWKNWCAEKFRPKRKCNQDNKSNTEEMFRNIPCGFHFSQSRKDFLLDSLCREIDIAHDSIDKGSDAVNYEALTLINSITGMAKLDVGGALMCLEILTKKTGPGKKEIAEDEFLQIITRFDFFMFNVTLLYDHLLFNLYNLSRPSSKEETIFRALDQEFRKNSKQSFSIKGFTALKNSDLSRKTNVELNLRSRETKSGDFIFIGDGELRVVNQMLENEPEKDSRQIFSTSSKRTGQSSVATDHQSLSSPSPIDSKPVKNAVEPIRKAGEKYDSKHEKNSHGKSHEKSSNTRSTEKSSRTTSDGKSLHTKSEESEEKFSHVTHDVESTRETTRKCDTKSSQGKSEEKSSCPTSGTNGEESSLATSRTNEKKSHSARRKKDKKSPHGKSEEKSSRATSGGKGSKQTSEEKSSDEEFSEETSCEESSEGVINEEEDDDDEEEESDDNKREEQVGAHNATRKQSRLLKSGNFLKDNANRNNKRLGVFNFSEKLFQSEKNARKCYSDSIIGNLSKKVTKKPGKNIIFRKKCRLFEIKVINRNSNNNNNWNNKKGLKRKKIFSGKWKYHDKKKDYNKNVINTERNKSNDELTDDSLGRFFPELHIFAETFNTAFKNIPEKDHVCSECLSYQLPQHVLEHCNERRKYDRITNDNVKITEISTTNEATNYGIVETTASVSVASHLSDNELKEDNACADEKVDNVCKYKSKNLNDRVGGNVLGNFVTTWLKKLGDLTVLSKTPHPSLVKEDNDLEPQAETEICLMTNFKDNKFIPGTKQMPLSSSKKAKVNIFVSCGDEKKNQRKKKKRPFEFLFKSFQNIKETSYLRSKTFKRLRNVL